MSTKNTQKWEKISTLLGPTSFGIKILKFIQEKHIHSPDILDVGAGTGRDTVYFLKSGYTVSAQDISQEGLKLIATFSKERNLQLEESILGDINNIELQKKYNIIFSANTLHYFNHKQTQHIFTKLFKALEPQGFLCIRVKALTQGEEEYGTDKNGNFKHLFTTNYINTLFSSIKGCKIIESKQQSDIHTEINGDEKILNFIDCILQKNQP